MSCKYSEKVMCNDQKMCRGCPCEEVAQAVKKSMKISEKGTDKNEIRQKQ
jgi:hypothetical protein